MKSAYLHDAKWMFKNQLHFYTLTSPSLLRWLFYMVKTFVFQKNWCNSHSHSSQMFCLLLSCIICYSSKICITSASQNTIELIDHHCLWRLHPYVDRSCKMGAGEGKQRRNKIFALVNCEIFLGNGDRFFNSSDINSEWAMTNSNTTTVV